MNFEILLTSASAEPVVLLSDRVVRVQIAPSDDFDQVLATKGPWLPEPYKEQLRLLWGGEFPGRVFTVLDSDTVVISAGRVTPES